MKDSYLFIQKFINRLILEKPDFYKNTKVGFSAILLYSKYMQQNIDSNNQLTLFNSDFLVQEFEDLIDSVFKRNSRNIINNSYIKEDILETIHQTSVLVMRLKKDIKMRTFSEIGVNRQALPKILYVRESFVNNNKINSNKKK